MPSSITINSAITRIPGVYSSSIIDASGTVGLGDKNLCVVGPFPQLEPANATSYKVQKSVLLESVIPGASSDIKDLDKLWRNAFPQNQFGTSSKTLTFVNAQVSTQSIGFIANTLYGNNAAGNLIKLYSKIWGAKGKDTTLSLTKDADNNFTIRGKALGGETQRVIVDSNYKNPIELYVKNATGATVKIRNSAIIVKNGSGTEVLNQNLTAFTTLNELFEALIATGLFYAPGDTGFATHPSAVNTLIVEPKNLDELMAAGSDADPTETAQDAKITLTAFTQGIIDAINVLGAESLPFTAEIVDTNKRVPHGNITAIALPANGVPDVKISAQGTGPTVGSDGNAPDDDDYETALTACKDENFQIITCLDDTTAVLLKLKTHLDECESISKYRNAWFGAEGNLSLDSIYSSYVLQAKSPYISVVGQGFKNAIGNFIDSPKHLAFLLMCMQGDLPPATPLNNKLVNITGTKQAWERDKSAVLNDAIGKSITVLTKSGSVFTGDLKVSRALTTFRANDISVNTEVSARESLNTCLADLQNFLTLQIGETISSGKLSLIESLAKQRLDFQRSSNIIKDFRNVKSRLSGDTIFIDFDLAVANPLNFIKLTAFVTTIGE